jgi:hypothetical protein
MDEEQKAVCGKCNFPLDELITLSSESRKPCLKCGSLNRVRGKIFEESVSLYSQLRLKSKRQGRRKPLVEVVEGDDYRWSSGVWVKLSRLVDHVNNWYAEAVTKLDSDEVIHHRAEPLNLHIGHGSDIRNSNK